MLLDRITKETTDVSRIVVDMSWWLDPYVETLDGILTQKVIQGTTGWSEAPYPPPGSPPPYDPTPLDIRSAAFDPTHTQLIVFVEFGTPGLVYTCQFVLHGTSTREITIELGVQLSGVPPVQYPPPPPPPASSAGLYLPLAGGTMQGPLYLYEDPLFGTEAATRHYVDNRLGVGSTNGPFLPIAGGTMLGPLNYSVAGTLQMRSAQARAGDSYNAKDFGAIGDGNAHPLFSITSFNGVATAGWTLTQWQTIFPFATSTSNEMDHVSIMGAIVAGARDHKSVHIPNGRYRAAETLPVTISSGGPITVFGDGRGATLCESYGTVDWFNIIYTGSLSATVMIDFADMAIYPASNTVGGNGIFVTGPGDSSLGRPAVFVARCSIGNVGGGPDGTLGAYATGVNCKTCSFLYADNCYFAGRRDSSGGLHGNGVQVNGDNTFPSFGPIMTKCTFFSMDRSAQAGDGTNAWVQGLQMDCCVVVYCNYGVYWVNGPLGGGNDGLMVSGGTTLQALVAGVYSDGVQIHNLTGNYWLGMPNASLIHIANSNNINCFLTVSGNTIVGFGYAGCTGVRIESGTAIPQSVYHITGNTFVSFNYAPVVLASGSKHVVITGNTFSDCVTAIDSGTNVWFDNVAVSGGGSTTSSSTLFQYGVPGGAQPQYQGWRVWTSNVAKGATLWDPTTGFGGGGLTNTGHIHNMGYTILGAAFGTWSAHNWGKQLYITTDQSGSNDPAIAITDSNGINLVGIGNNGGALRFSSMPPYADSTTVPVDMLALTPAGGSSALPWTFTNMLTLNPTECVAQNPWRFFSTVKFDPLPTQAVNDAAAAAAGVQLHCLYRNGSALQVRTV